MTDAQRAALKPGDTVLVRAVVVPIDNAHGASHGFDARDCIRVCVDGGATFWAPDRHVEVALPASLPKAA